MLFIIHYANFILVNIRYFYLYILIMFNVRLFFLGVVIAVTKQMSNEISHFQSSASSVLLNTLHFYFSFSN